MKHRAKVSVIMGVYNPEKRSHLFAAVNSVIGQSFSDWELILCDDGSEEGKAAMIWEAAGLDERIFYIRNSKNRGLAHALNECIGFAEGEFIARMDADDIAKKDRLEKQYRFLKKRPEYQWVGSNAQLIDSRGVWGIRRMPRIPGKRDFLTYSPYIHPTVMFRKKVLMENEGYRETRQVLQCEDYELFMRLHRKGYRGYNLQEPLLQYREDAGACKRRRYGRRFREVRVRFRGFQELGILRGRGFYYVLRPLLAGAVPISLYRLLRRIRKGE